MDPHTKGRKNQTMRYVKSEKYNTPALQQKIMGPNPIKLEEEELLPFVKHGGYLSVTAPGMKKDCHDHLPPELLLS